MTNLDSLLKSRDITLPTKFRLVKAMVFPVVMYGCESWIIKKAQHWRIDAFEVLEKTPESPLDCKEIQPVHPKGNQSWIFIGRTDTEAEAPILWPPEAKSLMLGKIEGRRRRGQQSVRCLNHITNSMHMSLSKLWEMVRNREPWHAVVKGVTKSWTRLSDWTTTIFFSGVLHLCSLGTLACNFLFLWGLWLQLSWPHKMNLRMKYFFLFNFFKEFENECYLPVKPSGSGLFCVRRLSISSLSIH